MPFTPFHMGPGIAMKSLAGRHFSLTTFGFSQVAMDVEPLVRILRGDAVPHGPTHTYLGATLIGLVCVVIGRPICEYPLQYWTPDPESGFLTWLWGNADISRSAAFAGAFAGTYSHVFLDGLMHADLRPLAPFSDAQPLFFAVPVDAVHIACVLAGLGGALVTVVRFFLRKLPSARDVESAG